MAVQRRLQGGTVVGFCTSECAASRGRGLPLSVPSGFHLTTDLAAPRPHNPPRCTLSSQPTSMGSHSPVTPNHLYGLPLTGDSQPTSMGSHSQVTPGEFHMMIPKGKSAPVQKTQMFSTVQDGQEVHPPLSFASSPPVSPPPSPSISSTHPHSRLRRAHSKFQAAYLSLHSSPPPEHMHAHTHSRAYTHTRTHTPHIPHTTHSRTHSNIIHAPTLRKPLRIT